VIFIIALGPLMAALIQLALEVRLTMKSKHLD